MTRVHVPETAQNRVTFEQPLTTIELRSFQAHRQLSYDSNAFTASIWVSGKRRGTVADRGTGEAMFFDWKDAEHGAAIEALARRQFRLPSPFGDGFMASSLEMIVARLADDLLMYRQMKKWTKKGTVVCYRLVGDTLGQWRNRTYEDGWSPAVKAEMMEELGESLEAIGNEVYAKPPKTFLLPVPSWMGPAPDEAHSTVELAQMILAEAPGAFSAMIRADGNLIGSVSAASGFRQMAIAWDNTDAGERIEGLALQQGDGQNSLETILRHLAAAHEVHVLMVDHMEEHPGVWWRSRSDEQGWWRVEETPWSPEARSHLIEQRHDLDCFGQDRFLDPPTAFLIDGKAES